MLSKGVHDSCEGCEHCAHRDDRIEQAEKELAESEATLAEVPGLRETYVRRFLASVKATDRPCIAFKSSRDNFRAQKNEPQKWSNFVRSR